jgi:iron complex transport system substrate-binding protein
MWKITSNIIFKIVVFGLIMTSFLACQTATSSADRVTSINAWEDNAYATKFKLHSTSDSVFLQIESPVANQFIDYAFRKYAVEEIALSNSVQWSFLKLLVGEKELPGAIVGHKYFCDSIIHSSVASGGILELKGAETIDEEQMILSGCKLLLQDGFGQRILSPDGTKLYASLFVMEWKESHPLARLEWIKVLGALIGKEQEAKDIFVSKAKAYEALKNSYSNAPIECKVMTSAPYKNEWHIPAKNSYMETLISDAGGTLLHNESNEHVSQKLNLEEAFIAFKMADVWLLNASIEQLNILESAVPFFGKIKAVQEGNIYNYHKSKAYGNYFFWEDGVCQPEVLLSEYRQMFEGNLDQSKYYMHVE